MGWIYIIKNKLNGKSYIGQTIRPIKERLKEHRQGKNKRCRLIYRAIRKYGWNHFEKDCYKCPDEDLNKHEKWMVKLTGTLSPDGYNLKEGGSNGKLSDETKQKIGDGNRGKTRNKEQKQNMRKSKETRQKMREAQLGINNSMYGKTGEKNPMYGTTGEKSPTSKRVYQYDLDGTFIESFGSCREAGRQLKKDKSSIGKCACGTLKTAYKYKWSYNLDIFM